MRFSNDIRTCSRRLTALSSRRHRLFLSGFCIQPTTSSHDHEPLLIKCRHVSRAARVGPSAAAGWLSTLDARLRGPAATDEAPAGRAGPIKASSIGIRSRRALVFVGPNQFFTNSTHLDVRCVYAPPCASRRPSSLMTFPSLELLLDPSRYLDPASIRSVLIMTVSQ